MRLTQPLNGMWRLWGGQPGEGKARGVFRPDIADQDWIPVPVPGDVHSALVAAGRIPEPYYHTNVETIRWVEEQEWWYRTRFVAPPPPEAADTRDILVFDGLDTYATIYLNGEVLGSHGNMFRPARFDVTGRLRYGQENTLAVRLDPVAQRVAGRTLPGQWGRNPERVFVRKTQAHFSWDWAPRLVNVGIWQDVRLERYVDARLNFPYVRVLTLRHDTAIVAVECEVDTWGDLAALEVSAQLKHGSQELSAAAPVRDSVAHIVFVVPDAALWWPAGYGPQSLYTVTVSLQSREHVLDVFHDEVGLRTVALDRTPDPHEVGTERFTFLINGVPVFAKGANWIPADLMNGRVTRERYERLLRLFVEANGNMLRVWGGGQYEKEPFYRLADRWGILIWQDFMFACARYPDDPDFLAEVEAEAEYQVRRLRNRASLVMWVGNNENDWLEDLIFWKYPGHDFPGKRIYHELLPQIVARLDPSRPYWPSSPYGGNDHNGEQAGDRHNWHVWHGGVLPRRFGEPPRQDRSPEGVSYRHYAEDTARFVSEFGIQAAPVLETLRRVVPAEELYLNSPGVLFRIKDEPKDKASTIMRAHTGLPRDLREFVDFSMICQAEGLKFGIEHYRRRKFRCSGALFWQWNDCWPGISWSVADYYGFPKAAYFFVKRAFAPTLASFEPLPDGSVAVWVVNDRLQPVEDTLHWTYASFEGKVWHEGRVSVRVPPNSAIPIARISKELLDEGNPRHGFLWARSQNGRIAENRHFLVEIKDLERPPAQVTITWVEEEENGGLTARLRTDTFAYFVHLFVSDADVQYSDNWIDIPPGEERAVQLWHRRGQLIRPEAVHVRWL